MIEEAAHLVEIDGDYAWVETERRSSCSSCSAKGCGTGALSKVFGRRSQRLKVLNPIGAKAGDEVVLGIHEQALLKGSVAVYIMPLLGMLAGALLGEGLAPQWGSDSEALSIVLGLLGLAAGFFWLQRYNRGLSRDPRFIPVILRTASATPVVQKLSMNL